MVTFPVLELVYPRARWYVRTLAVLLSCHLSPHPPTCRAFAVFRRQRGFPILSVDRCPSSGGRSKRTRSGKPAEGGARRITRPALGSSRPATRTASASTACTSTWHRYCSCNCTDRLLFVFSYVCRSILLMLFFFLLSCLVCFHSFTAFLHRFSINPFLSGGPISIQ